MHSMEKTNYVAGPIDWELSAGFEGDILNRNMCGALPERTVDLHFLSITLLWAWIVGGIGAGMLLEV
ncbi:hypothetical protein RHMOL_Rhmol06G0018800 [Rhododendron molle]|uniref:Uncharacterized protein n=1 Tax=Rhododendron molle TaxID=49168 RepID=A0ACC0N849_RHOML|nr:hypothetical protein RHMOL_Rhmol06G0018800 [Rhododendron molle]